MFDRIGEKIKKYALIMFAIYVISGFIGGIVTGIAAGGFGGFMLFLVVFALSVLIGYLSVMFIYGVGQLIEDTSAVRKNTQELYDITYETYSLLYNQYGSKPKANAESKPAAPAVHAAAARPVQMGSLGGWICKKCDARNGDGTRYCTACGAAKE